MGPQQANLTNGSPGGESLPSMNKSIKTVRLHWREAAPNMMPTIPGATDSLWTSLNKVQLDTNRLGQLFELKHTEVKIKVKTSLKIKKNRIILRKIIHFIFKHICLFLLLYRKQ
jgi:hypothetical protein